MSMPIMSNPIFVLTVAGDKLTKPGSITEILYLS